MSDAGQFTVSSSTEKYSSLLGPSEPNWAVRVRWRRLAGLLNLSCLLSETTLITDTDICENANFLQSFKKSQAEGLYARLRRLAELNFIKILIRDQAYRPDTQIATHTFTDIYDAWLQQDPKDAWVLHDFTDERRLYYQDLDSWALDHTIRYPYRQVKELFMANLRRAASDYSADTAFMVSVRGLSKGLQDEYFSMLTRDWFSLTTVNQIFQRYGLTLADPAMHYQGLLNQISYSAYANSSLVGLDVDSVTGELQAEVPKQLPNLSVEAIMERADALLDGPPLAILGLLSPDEIAQLRTLGRPYFALLSLSRDEEFRSQSSSSIGNQFVTAATSYWGQVCDYIRSRYGPVVERRTRLGIFFGYDPSRDSLPSEVFSLAVEAGVGVLGAALPGIGQRAASSATSAVKLIRLKFLFVTPTEDFKKIERVLPRSFWFRRSHPEVLP
ncbi:MAG: hypothetical protein ABSB76_36495 [Streptosporangiaceae bacterium]|jgi:hypothetical protein